VAEVTKDGEILLGAVGVNSFASKKEASLQGLCVRMFSRMATSTEREQILERVRSLDGVVDGEAPRRAAANAAIAIAQSRHPPQLLPGEAVDFRPRGTRPLWSGAAGAPPP
jgi:hypothetical protein